MNAIIQKVEKQLAQYSEIEQYTSTIRSAQSGSISVTFSPEAEFNGFPEMLKNEIESFCIDIGPPDWQISGVGRGFDNSLREGNRNSRIVLYGYNLDHLKRHAFRLKTELEKMPRVEKTFVNGKATYLDRVDYDFSLKLDEGRLQNMRISRGELLNNVSQLTRESRQIFTLYDKNGDPEPVYIKNIGANNSRWNFYHNPISLSNQRGLKLSAVGTIKKERTTEFINKENMQYKIVVEFDFIGSYGQKKILLEELIKDFLPSLPIGYKLEQQYYKGGDWEKDNKKVNPTLLILLIILIIYAICAIVLESLTQPLLIIATIPLSLIGIFIVSIIYKIPYSDGTFAAIILLSGLTVNSALYIINEFNNLLKQSHYIDNKKRALYKAFNKKIIPIILTILSTVLGLIPFIIEGKKDMFWYALSVCTIGGLLFSLLILFLFVPTMISIKTKQTKNINHV